MIKRTFITAALAGLLVAPFSAPALAAGVGEAGIQVAQASCFARGRAVAAQRGATLVSAEAAQRGGRQVCRVVLLFDGGGGERPRREEVFVDP